MLGLLLMHKIPWKTVGLVVAVTLGVMFVVNNMNLLGLKSLFNPSTSGS